MSRNRLESLFGAELDAAPDAKALQMANLRVTKLRTRSLEQLMAVSDDPLSIMQLAIGLAQYNNQIRPQNWEFDLYRVDVLPADSSGASAVVAVPKGVELKAGLQSNEVTAVMGDSTLRRKVKIQKASVAMVGAETAGFDQSAVALAPTVNWAVHPAWSYLFPRMWPNGLTIRRITMVGYPPGVWLNQFSVPTTSASSLHAYYKGVLLSTAVVSLDHFSIVSGVSNIFTTTPAALQRYETWARFALGVFMTGFNDPLALEGQGAERKDGSW